MGPLIGTLAQGILLSFRFVLFFFLLILFPSPVPRSGLSEGQSRGKVPPSTITSALPQVSMLPGSCSPSRPCGRLCVPRCVIQQSLQGPCPVYCSHPLLCAWPRTQVNHLAQGPPRELCLQVPSLCQTLHEEATVAFFWSCPWRRAASSQLTASLGRTGCLRAVTIFSKLPPWRSSPLCAPVSLSQLLRYV